MNRNSFTKSEGKALQTVELAIEINNIAQLEVAISFTQRNTKYRCQSITEDDDDYGKDEFAARTKCMEFDLFVLLFDNHFKSNVIILA